MWRQELVSELKAARNGDRQKVINKYIKMTGKTAQTLYRIAQKNGYFTSRKKRADKGKCGLTDEQITFVSALIHTSAREIKGTIMDVETALAIAEENNIIEPGTVSVSRMQTILKEREMNAAALNTPEPHIQMRSLHPNHVHVFDASVCIQYYLKGRKGLRMMREDMFYKNKPDNFAKIKDRLIRYVLADHFSGVIWTKYYLAKGENQESLYDFLISAWSNGKHKRFPFRGVPFYVLMDAGAANTSKAILTLLERLEIEIPPSMPHNPRRQGAAEVVQNIVESKFESRLRFQPAHTVEDLNTWALDWCVGFNGTKIHSRHKMTRTECWLKIKQEQLRDLPSLEILHELFANPEEERTVTGRYSISFKTEEYDLRHIEGIVPNRSKVKVILRPYHWPEVGVMFNEKEYLVKPIERVDGGFREDSAVIGQDYKRMPDSITQKAKKTAENYAYGEGKRKDAVPFEGLAAMGNQADKVTYDFVPRIGSELQVAASGIMDKQISIMMFLKKLIAANVEVTPDLNQAIRAHYGTSISLAESERLIALSIESGGLSITDIGGGDVALKAATS